MRYGATVEHYLGSGWITAQREYNQTLWCTWNTTHKTVNVMQHSMHARCYAGSTTIIPQTEIVLNANHCTWMLHLTVFPCRREVFLEWRIWNGLYTGYIFSREMSCRNEAFLESNVWPSNYTRRCLTSQSNPMVSITSRGAQPRKLEVSNISFILNKDLDANSNVRTT